MNNQTDFFKWDDLTDNDKTAPKKLITAFKRAGAEIASSWVEGKVKRENGVTYRQICFVFADSQQITLRVKQTGDIYQVRLNNRVLPLKNQDDTKKALGEIVKAVEANANKYQRTLSRRKIELPEGMQSTVKRKETLLADREAELDQRIQEAEEELAELVQQARQAKLTIKLGENYVGYTG